MLEGADSDSVRNTLAVLPSPYTTRALRLHTKDTAMIKSVFISSSGDLAAVREGIRDDLCGWLDQHGFADLLRPYLWEEDKEDGRLLSDRLPIQAQLPDPAAFDVPLTICLFGERCGSPLQDKLDPLVSRRFDRWRAEGDGPGLLHPWPGNREAQDQALACGQYPLTGTVYELISAHEQPDEADNLIVACVVDRTIAAETLADSVVLNGRKLHARLTSGLSTAAARSIQDEVYDPQAQALVNLLKHLARKLRFVTAYQSEDEMRREVFEIAQKKLRKKLGIASLRNPFKQSLAHWTVDDEKLLPGRNHDISKIVTAMKDRDDFVLLQGRSGCGKSSLMQSGVMRKLREVDGSVSVPFRPTELIAGSGDGDALDRLARLIAETADVPFATGGPMVMRPQNYAQQLLAKLEAKHVTLVIGLDQFEEIIDDLKLERERSARTPQSGWWLVIHFLRALCDSPRIRLIATLESAREKSFKDLQIGESLGLLPRTFNVDATDDTIAEVARSGFYDGGLPLDPAVIEAIKTQWRAFERGTPNDNASPLPLACLFLQQLYERFEDQAGATAGERLENHFQQAGSEEDDRFLTLEEIGGEEAIAFADIIQNLADEAWRDGGGNLKFADPIEESDDFNGLNNFLTPLVTVDHDGQMQPRKAVEVDADAPTLRFRKAFRERRLLVPVSGEMPLQVRPVHQALVDRWSPARRWLAFRKEQMLTIQQFREDAAHYSKRGETVPLKEDGSTLRAAASTLSEEKLNWQMCRSKALKPEDVAVRDQALAVFDTAENPLTIIEGSLNGSTYVHLAADYHRVDLLRRFIASVPECLKAETRRGDSLLHCAVWSEGPAVPFLLKQGAPLKTAKQSWHVIAPSISEGLNDNFEVLADSIALDDAIETTWQTRMVHLAARYGNMHVIEHLANRGALLDVQDKYEQTALHEAAKSDQVAAFVYLLPHLDIRSQDAWKGTAITDAARFGAANVLSAYLAYEEDADRLRDVLHHRNKTGDTPLMIAARYRQAEALRVLLQPDLGDHGNPLADEHRGENGDTLFHNVFRGVSGEKPTDADRFAARTVVEILRRDGRLDPSSKNKQGETPFDLGAAFPEARRVLRQDDRVPKDYDTMTPAMRIEDLSSRRPATVLRLLNEAPQALTDRHQLTPEQDSKLLAQSNGKPLTSDKPSTGETGLEILVRKKNHAVLATLVEDPVHWTELQNAFRQLLPVAAVPAAVRLREALLCRFTEGEIGADEAGELLGASIEAEDEQTARALVEQEAALTLRRDELGRTVLHQAAITGDADRFKSVLAIGPFALPRDAWGRRPSDLASDLMADAFRDLEADMDDPTAEKAAAAVSSAIAGQSPFLCLEQDGRSRDASEGEIAALQQSWDEQWGDIDGYDLRVFELPFHPDVPLLELRPGPSSAATGRLCFLYHGNSLYRLNGTSPPIHEVNGKETPRINEKTVLDYLCFFCFFVRGEKGPFLIVDQLDNAFLPELGERRAEVESVFRRPRVWGKDEQGHWLVSGLIYYDNAMFAADFRVQPSGMVEMDNDTPLLVDLPARVNAPLELQQLR